jgi:hypothetical protein
MRRLRDRAARLRWMAVPLSAYSVVTVVLPLFNGAARRDDFARHVAWVAGGCAVVVTVALLVQTVSGLAAAARARMIRGPGAPSAGRHGGGA